METSSASTMGMSRSSVLLDDGDHAEPQGAVPSGALIDVADVRLLVADANRLIGVGRRRIYRLLDLLRLR